MVDITLEKVIKLQRSTLMDKISETLMLIFIFMVAVLLLTSCSSTVEILDGLCYNDRDGTFICPVEEQKEPKPTILLECDKRNLIEYCDGRKDCYCVDHNDMEDMTNYLWG